MEIVTKEKNNWFRDNRQHRDVLPVLVIICKFRVVFGGISLYNK